MQASLDWLPPKTRELTQQTVAGIVQGLGEKVTAILLVGPAVHPPRHQSVHLPELLVVVSDLPVAALGNLAHQVSHALGRGVRLQLFTKRELLRSADVFTLELADYQARHVLLHGTDPFGELHYTPAELRRSLEQALRAMGRTIRQRVLQGLGSDGKLDDPTRALADGIDQLVVAAHHTLTLLGAKPPQTEIDLITALAARAEIDPAPLLHWVGLIRSGEQPAQPAEAAGDLMAVIDAATRAIDALGVH